MLAVPCSGGDLRSVLNRSSAPLLCIFLLACHQTPKPGHDAGPTDAALPTDAGRIDAGSPDAGTCASNADCNAIQYCNLLVGQCLPAKNCVVAANTDPEGELSCEAGERDYCAHGGCYCDVNRGGGVCLPRLLPCASCSSDLQCGADQNFYGSTSYTAACAALGTSKFCLPLAATGCPPGYKQGTTPTTQKYCLPNSGTCGTAGSCAQDTDCDPASAFPICDTASGKCVAACTFDYETGTSSCPAGQVCHADPALLVLPGNPNFGRGHCGPPCDVDGGYVCPTGTPAVPWGCVPDGSDTAPAKVDRCRPEPPSCLRNADCPANPTYHVQGVCLLETQGCTVDCASSADCDPSYYCAGDKCTDQGCADAGGTNVACGLSQFCCGETGAPSCPQNVSQGDCFTALDPPWCGTCLAGQTVTTPAGAARPRPSVCALGFQWNSCDPTVAGQCPHGWGCEPGPFFCTSDSDCGTGGSCGIVTTPWGTVQGCLCTPGKTCPTGSSCGIPTQSTACSANWCGMSPCFGTNGS